MATCAGSGVKHTQSKLMRCKEMFAGILMWRSLFPCMYGIWNCGSHFSARRGDSRVARRPQNRAKGEAKPWRADKRHVPLETLFDLLKRALSEVDFASRVFMDVTNKSLLLFKAIELFYLHLKLKDTDRYNLYLLFSCFASSTPVQTLFPLAWPIGRQLPSFFQSALIYALLQG